MCYLLAEDRLARLAQDLAGVIVEVGLVDILRLARRAKRRREQVLDALRVRGGSRVAKDAIL